MSTSPSPSATPSAHHLVPTLRVELASAATAGRTVTWDEALAAVTTTSGVVHEAEELLRALGDHCAERGEPDLASLVLLPGAGGRPACDAERRRVWLHWGGESAVRAGTARTGGVATLA